MNSMTPSSSTISMRTSSHPMKKVAVIGAGLSGLVTIKELLEESHSVVCFENEANIGGAFNRKKDEDYGAYNDLHLTISNYFMSYSSFPPKDAKRRYWTAAEYANYLNDFAREFSLTDYIHFNTTVLSIDPADEETWRITYRKNGKVLEEYVDAVAICSGKFRQPKIPQFKGLDRFKGTIHHSYRYKSPETFRDKDVVCIGAGESGSDIVHQIAKVARTSHLVVNRPKHIIPRMIFGDTNDARTTRASHYSYLVSQSTLEATIKKRILDRDILSQNKLDSWSMWKYLGKYGFHGEFSNKNDAFFQDVDHGRLGLHLFGVDHLYEDGVVLKDGTKIPCTDIMLSTGYATQFDLIHHPAARDAAANLRNNLFHMIHPDLRESLVWIGYVRPDVGGVPVVAELQARYFARLLAKKAQLPPRDELIAEISQLKKREDFHFCLEPDHPENVKFYHITSQIAEKIGARARWYHLLPDLKLMFFYYFGSMVACGFRLVGPGSNRKQATEFIKRVGMIKAPLGHRLFITSITSLLSVLAPAYRRVFKLLGVEENSVERRGKCRSVREILERDWPARQARSFDDNAPLRSLFQRDYEFEGFKFLLTEYYGFPPQFFATPSLTVADLDQALKNSEYKLSYA